LSSYAINGYRLPYLLTLLLAGLLTKIVTKYYNAVNDNLWEQVNNKR
jgi:hypothetical protein